MIFVILAQQQGLIDKSLVTILTFIALISIAVSTYIVTFNDKLYFWLEKYLALFERRRVSYDEESAGKYEFILFGYRKGGHEFVRVFKQLKKKFVVVDYDPEVVEILERRRISYLYGDATDIELLEEAGIKSAKLIVSTITDFEMTSALLKLIESHNPAAVVICQADSAEEAAKLYHQGASYVIFRTLLAAKKLVNLLKLQGFAKAHYVKHAPGT